MTDVAANYRAIVERVNQVALTAGRDPGEIRILGAAKTQDVRLIQAAVDAGVRLIGENYVQEAQCKRKNLARTVEWHMIGHLQRNKAKSAVALFDVIESLDNAALARELDKEGRRRNIKVRTFVEVNLAGEESKSGVAKDKVIDLLQTAAQLSHVSVEGLMTMPPFHQDAEEIRRYFRELRELRDRLCKLRLANVDLKELSMGMTHDYELAVAEGATIVRIGTGLFGQRKIRNS